MNAQNYTTSFTVEDSPERVFDAVNDVRGWWAGDIEGETDRLGGEFTYRYEQMHYSKQKVTELSRGRRVVWHVTEASINFVQDKNEWTGTDIVFDLTPTEGGTEVRFTHVGLVPQVECYGGCSDAWGYYVGNCLRDYVTKRAAATTS